MVIQRNASQFYQTESEEMACGPAVFADKELFLLLLYDKAISCMNEALELIDMGDIIGKGDKLIRAQDIVLELSDALDESAGEVAFNLERLYHYVYRRLIDGNNRLNRDAIIEARTIMSELYDAWRTIIVGADSAAVLNNQAVEKAMTGDVSWSPAP